MDLTLPNPQAHVVRTRTNGASKLEALTSVCNQINLTFSTTLHVQPPSPLSYSKLILMGHDLQGLGSNVDCHEALSDSSHHAATSNYPLHISVGCAPCCRGICKICSHRLSQGIAHMTSMQQMMHRI